jgi:hypothetical protein
MTAFTDRLVEANRAVWAAMAGHPWPAARVNPRMPRVLVDHQVVVSEPKSRAGRRSLALDPATVAALRDHLVVQEAEREVVGARYMDSGLLFTWPDGRPIHRRASRNGSSSTWWRLVCLGSPFMACATATPPRRSRPACP